MTDKRFEYLLAKLLDEDITLAEVDELLSAIQQVESRHDEFMSHLVLWDMFEQDGCPERSPQVFLEACRTRLSIDDDFTTKVKQRIIDLETPRSSKKTSHVVAVGQGPKRKQVRFTESFMDLLRYFYHPVRLAVVCILISFVCYTVFMPNKPIVANLHQTFQAHWLSDSPSGKIPAGPLKLERGFAQLNFVNGVEVIIEGPAHVILNNPQEMTLRKGKLTANVNPDSVGFTVKTPNAEVVDLSTRFGVSAQEDGQTEVVVFEGKVDLRSHNGNSLIVNELQSCGLLNNGKLKPIQALPKYHTYYMDWEQVQSLPQVWGQCRIVRYFLAESDNALPRIPYDQMLLVPEERNLQIMHDISGVATTPGFYDGYSLLGQAEGTIKKGTRVDSYLITIQPRPNREQTVYVSTIRFPRNIVGILSGPERLKNSDSPHERLRAWYGGFSEQDRMLEMLDTFVINKDRTTLSVTLTVQKRMNQIRILTETQ